LSLGLTWTPPSSSSQEASRFKTDAETGRMIIDGDNSGEEEPQKSKLKPEYTDGNLYKEGLTSVHGFTRDPVKLLVDTFVARRWRCQEEPYAYSSLGQVVGRGLAKGVQVLGKYLLLGEDSFVTRTAFIGPLGIICI